MCIVFIYLFGVLRVFICFYFLFVIYFVFIWGVLECYHCATIAPVCAVWNTVL